MPMGIGPKSPATGALGVFSFNVLGILKFALAIRDLSCNFQALQEHNIG